VEEENACHNQVKEDYFHDSPYHEGVSPHFEDEVECDEEDC